VRSARAGAIQAIDAKKLADWARRHDCLVVLRRRVGDFIPADAVLFEIFGTASPAARPISTRCAGWSRFGPSAP
jgi:uncharacterized membrane protein